MSDDIKPVDNYNKALEEFLTPEELAVVAEMRANVQIKEKANYVAEPLFDAITSYEMPEDMLRATNIRTRLAECKRNNAPLHLLPGKMEDFFHLDVEKRRSPSLEFCDILKSTGNIASACAKVKTHYPTLRISPQMIEDYRVLVPAFSDTVDLALDLFNAKLEEAAVDRAVNGVDEDVYFQGVKCGTKTKHSDDLLKFLMTANNPSKYGKADGKGGGGSPIVVQIATFTQSADYGGDNGIITTGERIIDVTTEQTEQ